MGKKDKNDNPEVKEEETKEEEINVNDDKETAPEIVVKEVQEGSRRSRKKVA